MLHDQLAWWLVLGLSSLCLVALVRRWLLRWWRSRGRRKRQQRALRGEDEAIALLADRGFQVLDSQVPGSWEVRVGDRRHDVQLRADHLVERDGRRHIAEVKTGRRAPSIDHASTRRQLLEYRLAFDVEGIVLVDPDADRVRRVEFRFDDEP